MAVQKKVKNSTVQVLCKTMVGMPISYFNYIGTALHNCSSSGSFLKQDGQMTMNILPYLQEFTLL